MSDEVMALSDTISNSIEDIADKQLNDIESISNESKLCFNRENDLQFLRDIETTKITLQNKLKWATNELNNSSNTVRDCIQYCDLIKICSDTLQSMNKLIISQKNTFNKQ